MGQSREINVDEDIKKYSSSIIKMTLAQLDEFQEMQDQICLRNGDRDGMSPETLRELVDVANRILSRSSISDLVRQAELICQNESARSSKIFKKIDQSNHDNSS
jgi:hypothetical protein